MKLLKTIIKNFRILFRLKTSLIGIILGPLLIIALVGFAFNSSSQFQISVGYVTQDNSSLTTDYVNTLKEEYQVQEFNNKSNCVSNLKQSLIQMCIIFPKDFVLENNKSNNITFVVDKSRTNIVYSVFNNVNDKIGLKTNELSKDLTNKLISTLDSTSTKIDTNLGLLIRIKNSLNNIKSNIDSNSKSLEELDLSSKKLSTNQDSDLNDIKIYVKSLSDKGRSLVKDGLSTVADVKPAVSSNATLTSELNSLESDLNSFNSTCNSKYNDTSKKISAIKLNLDKLSKEVSSLNSKLDSANSKVGSALSNLKKDLTDLNSVISNVDKVKQNLETSSGDISSISITSSEEIVNPIHTNIETISSDNNKLVILFPYLLMLIIMFISLMLASTLIIVEKKSKAYFRVFTTPTKDSFFIWTTFLTSFIVVFIQTAIILILMKLFFIDLFFSNILVNSSIIILAISIFVMIGMAIGYLFSSQQGTNMASISIGAIFLFISNMILPIETISPTLQKIAHFNPYVIASETFRQSILFSVNFQPIIFNLGILFIYSLVIIFVIVFVQKIAKQSFFRNIPHILSKRKLSDNSIIINGKIISSEKDSIKLVHQLNDKEFVDLIAKSKIIKQFIMNNLEDKILSKSIKKMNKKEFFEYFIVKNQTILKNIRTNTNKLKNKPTKTINKNNKEEKHKQNKFLSIFKKRQKK